MTEPTPESHDWQDFYKNPPPPPPPPPPAASSTGKRIALFAASAVAALVGWWVVHWALTPTTSAADQRPDTVAPIQVDRVLPPPPSPTAAARKITVVAPDKLSGRAKSTDPELVKLAADEGTRLQGIPQVGTVAAAAYGSHAKKNLILVLAATSPMVAGNDADTFVNNALQGSDIVVQPAAFDAGPLGGRVVCGEAKTKSIQYSICGWADDGSLGIILCYYTSVTKMRAEFHALRAAVEQVG